MKDFLRLSIRPWGLLTAIGFLAVVSSLAGFLGRVAWWMDLGAHFRVQYVFLFVVLAACYFAGKKTKWALGALLLAGLNAWPVVMFLLPPADKSPSHGPSLRAMLVNVNTQHGDPAKVMAAIEKENPDLVVLEEINVRWMNELAPLLQRYQVCKIETREDNFGIGLLTRVTTTSTQIVHAGMANVPSVFAHVVLDGKPVTVIATHPPPPGGSYYSACRNDQLKILAGMIGEVRGPLVLLGDLNVTPWSVHYRDFIRKSGLKNSSEGRGIHPTWPTFCPPLLIPIDHCLHTEDVVILDHRVGSQVGSDHYPVIVDFALVKTQ